MDLAWFDQFVWPYIFINTHLTVFFTVYMTILSLFMIIYLQLGYNGKPKVTWYMLWMPTLWRNSRQNEFLTKLFGKILIGSASPDVHFLFLLTFFFVFFIFYIVLKSLTYSYYSIKFICVDMWNTRTQKFCWIKSGNNLYPIWYRSK